MGKVCPRCGKAIPRNMLHKCSLAPAYTRMHDAQRERERREKETWRTKYDREYKRSRAAVLASCGGMCEVCGRVVFEPGVRGWHRVGANFGGVHHLVHLSQGGDNSTDNLMCLCADCHGIAHSKDFERACEWKGVISKPWAIRKMRKLREYMV